MNDSIVGLASRKESATSHRFCLYLCNSAVDEQFYPVDVIAVARGREHRACHFSSSQVPTQLPLLPSGRPPVTSAPFSLY